MFPPAWLEPTNAGLVGTLKSTDPRRRREEHCIKCQHGHDMIHAKRCDVPIVDDDLLRMPNFCWTTLTGSPIHELGPFKTLLNVHQLRGAKYGPRGKVSAAIISLQKIPGFPRRVSRSSPCFSGWHKFSLNFVVAWFYSGARS